MRIPVLAVVATLALGVSGLSAQSSKTISGFVSDSQCGATHTAASEGATKCVKGCLKRGGEPVVVSDGKVYHVKGKTDAVRALAGQDVTVTGTIDGDTLTVDSVTSKS